MPFCGESGVGSLLRLQTSKKMGSHSTGPQYEPGGYSAAVQQRTNMTQREDALKFEQGRIKALQEERLHIQKKTFTKWMNSFLQKVRMEVDDLFVDLADGRRLLKLLEIISGERLPRPNSGKMRVHKIENVNKSLSFLHTKVRLESIGAEDIVDGNPRLILGLIWTIILRFQIQEIEIDVDEENESSEKKSAKDALLLWCQRKTSGYHGVHIHNFSDSWRSGLGFNALIHAHRPDLFRWNDLPATDPVETLNHAFDVAHENLGIPKLLDAEDVDTTRPDEKSVMTYVASYYHTFARMKNEQKSGRRIANIIGQLMDCDARKAEYSRLVSALLEWIRLKVQDLNDRDLPNSLDGIQRLLLAFKQYRTVEKPPKYKERSEIEAMFFAVNTMHKSLVGEAWGPPEGQLPHDLEKAWQRLEQAEHAREIALRTELLRQQRLEQLNYKFTTKSVLRKGYLKEMIQVLSDPRYGSNLAQVDATVKKHEAISADILARKERFEDLSAMAAELVKSEYHGAEQVSRVRDEVLQRWDALLQLLEGHRTALAKLAALAALLREADATHHTVRDMKVQFSSAEAGRHLSDVERLLQAHALQELQLGALHDAIRRLLRQGNAIDGPAQPVQQLKQQLAHLEDEYDSLVAAAKDRKARLEDARSLYQFLEDHEEEEGWVNEKQRICRAEVAAKGLRAVIALRQKHTALLHEISARRHVAQRHRDKGQSLIAASHPMSAEIERRLSSLSTQWDQLQELADARHKQLADAAEVYQFNEDANETDSWIKERRPLASSSDVGQDAPSAAALLARHRALHEEIVAYEHEVQALRKHADRLAEAGIHELQLPTEVESAPAGEEEQWVSETRLVPADVWEEEPVERLEHRTVTEERSVPQVKALYAFTGQGISMQKGEVMFLISKTNPDWWSVRKADRTDGFVPANYVREIEPRLVPVQVRRPEKVRTVQRVKKTVLVKQVVPVRRAGRRPSRSTAVQQQRGHAPLTTVTQLEDSYADLLKLSAARRLQLEDAIKLFSLFAECDDLEKWCLDKEKMLKADDKEDSVDNAKRKYEKFVTDLSAASKRLEQIEKTSAELQQDGHGAAAAAAARTGRLRGLWDRLLRIKAGKEKSLEGASSVEVFVRTCSETLEWMKEKQQQLETGEAGLDLRTVRHLQRRHAQLERELEPVKERVRTVDLLADDVKSQYPSERSNVEGRQKQIQVMWAQCQQLAAARRSRLESAVGHQIFSSGAKQLCDVMMKIQEQLNQAPIAKDVQTAEALRKQHHELKDDIKAQEDEYKELVQLGEQLVSNNPSLTDVKEKVQQLKEAHDQIEKDWKAKEDRLQQLLQLAALNKEADQLDAASASLQAYLDYKDTGSSVEAAVALLKRHDDLSGRVTALDDRLAQYAARAQRNIRQGHYAHQEISDRMSQVVSRRDAVRQAIASRGRALQVNLAHQQFIAATDELQAWIEDKTKTAKDQSYRDLANLERKLQKHEAFERELQANEKQLRNVESMGQSLQSLDSSLAPVVGPRLEKLSQLWDQLAADSRDKGSKLRQAHAQRAHKRDVEDVRARLSELERSLSNDQTGTDLRSCRKLLNNHQALELELASLQSRSHSVWSSGRDLASGGHFDARSVEEVGEPLLKQCEELQPLMQKRRDRLQTALEVQKFAAEVTSELEWVRERLPAVSVVSTPSDLHGAQLAVKRHNKMAEEVLARKPVLDKILNKGVALMEDPSVDKEKILSLSKQLSDEHAGLEKACVARKLLLEKGLRAAQFWHEAREVESWLSDAKQHLATDEVGEDRHRATMLLTRHKAVELELDTYAAIVSEMSNSPALQTSGADAPQLKARHKELYDSVQQLRQLAAARREALVRSVLRHEYLSESEELSAWIQEQHAAASSDDYGHDYEHLLLLQSKFDELRHRVESGAERFSQCEELARKLTAQHSRDNDEIEDRQEALGASWQRLVDKLKSRASKLHAAGDIHRFHRDVCELLARAKDKQAALLQPPKGRERDVDGELLALDAQVQVLQEEGARLAELCPGENVAQIRLQQAALTDAWKALTDAHDTRRKRNAQQQQLQAFLTQVRDLSTWCSGLVSALSGAGRARDASAAQLVRAEHDAIKAEIEARDDSFRQAIQMADEMVQAGHPAAQEVEERCEALLAERGRLHASWSRRQVALDQLIDLHCFLRDARLMNDLCAAQEAALSAEISPTLSVEEVDNLLKKHEAFEKLLVTQDEKLSTLNSHGDKLLQQNHVESQRIADELAGVNERRKKIHALSSSRRAALSSSLERARFARDVSDARAWLADKNAALLAQQHGEVNSLEEKIKKLQKHQALCAEVQAHSPRLTEVCGRALDASQQEHVSALKADWDKLNSLLKERGRGLEEAQDMLEFNQHLEKIEAWIRDKELMVQAGELGGDYEHCSALIRKLDDLDSDMKVDDKQLTTLDHLADNLKKKGTTDSAAVERRRSMCWSRWKSLSGALKEYRGMLERALRGHAFIRDAADTTQRLMAKAQACRSGDLAKSLSAARALKKRHEAMMAEAQVLKDKIKALDIEGNTLAESYPERADEFKTTLADLHSGWEELQKLAVQRSTILDDSLAAHKFDDSIKELELWVSETVGRMRSERPADHIDDARHAHQETKAEIDGRQKSIAALKKQAETELSSQPNIAEKIDKLDQLSRTLDDAWKEREVALTQAQQLQQFKEQARQTEDWLAAKEAFLNNDDLGEDLDAVEALIRKHSEFTKLLESQQGKVLELNQLGAALAAGGHGAADFIKRTSRELTARAERLKKTCSARESRLFESRQLHEFLRALRHETDWIQINLQRANDTNYMDLSNLQSKIQRHAAFESELAANKGRIDDVVNTGEELIEAKHYASKDISKYVEELENQWRELQTASSTRRSRLQQSYCSRGVLRAADELAKWLHDIEAQLMSDDHGKDLASVTALLKRHSRLEQQVANKADTAAQLADNARQLADTDNFMADEILEKTDDVLKRYRQLSEPLQSRRANLEDAATLHRWERDAHTENKWLQEREPLLLSEESGASVAEAQALLRKHTALETELLARESSISSLSSRASSLASGGHFAGPQLEAGARALAANYQRARELASSRTHALKAALEHLQLLSDISEAWSTVQERRADISACSSGRDEESAQALQRYLADIARQLQALDTNITALELRAKKQGDAATRPSPSLSVPRAEELRALYDDTRLLCAKKEQRLGQAIAYYKFLSEWSEAQEWISEQMALAASEDYGLDVEHVEALQQDFDSFLTQLHASEGRIESVCEAGTSLLEDKTPEQDKVRQKIDDIRGLWEDLKELALARQEALAGARQVHEFDRSAEETVTWLAEKEAALHSISTASTSGAARRLDALCADLDAVRTAHQRLGGQAEKLGQAYPDAREHVSCKLEEVSDALAALARNVDKVKHQMALAEQLQAYFGTYQELMAWINETIARVTAPELAVDVPSAERLVARHEDLGQEIKAKEDAFNEHYSDGEKLIKEGHLMSEEISERMSTLRRREQLLRDTFQQRRQLYARHLDACRFKRDADQLDAWITSREPLVRDGKVGESVAQAEELLNRHRDLEEAIEAQRTRFEALRRITLVEQDFKQQKEREAAEAAEAAAARELQRQEMQRAREIKRIAEIRARDRTHEQPEPVVEAPSPPEEPPSPAPQFDKLPKHEGVKRAESMQVSTKTPKRTPSFTTRRRTQSFRRHRQEQGELPPVEIQGYLERKQEAGCGGKRATVRSWRSYYCVLCGQLLAFFRDEDDFKASRAAAPPMPIANATVTVATDYRKRAHVFRLECADGAEFLFACSSAALLQDWLNKLAFHAALPPQLQLTPYSADGDLRDRLHRASESPSSSAQSSPSPARRSQAEVLKEERERNIESTVLPSLPPRKLEPQEDAEDVVMRNSEPSWGRSRFSNGRDVNAAFISSQREAEGAPPLPSSIPPVIPERGPNLPERNPILPERNNNPEKPSVTALVNNYQRMVNPASSGQTSTNNTQISANPNSRSWNNNWPNVETTSHFYSASEIAYGSSGGTRPASVAGSGGSPALDQRPASRSSGESELSLGGNPKEKKDKKGVFGGLFSRKKRPQSHM